MLHSGGHNKKLPTSWVIGYLTPASPTLQSGGGGGSLLARKWADWLYTPCRFGVLKASR